MRILTKLPISAKPRRLLGLTLMWSGLLTANALFMWHPQPLTALMLSTGSALLLPLGLALWLSGRAPAASTGGQVLRTAWVAAGVVLALVMVYYRYQLYQAELIIQAYQTGVLPR